MSSSSGRDSVVRGRTTAAAIFVVAFLMAATAYGLSSRSLQERSASLFWSDLGARHVPTAAYIPQKSWNDCGLAALSELLSELGASREALEEVAALPPPSEGLTIGEMTRLAGELGFNLTAAQPEVGWAGRPTPYVQLLERGHYVTVRRGEKDGIEVGDPAGGVYTLSEGDLASLDPTAVIYR